MPTWPPTHLLPYPMISTPILLQLFLSFLFLLSSLTLSLYLPSSRFCPLRCRGSHLSSFLRGSFRRGSLCIRCQPYPALSFTPPRLFHTVTYPQPAFPVTRSLCGPAALSLQL